MMENRLAAENIARQRDRLDEMERINRELEGKSRHRAFRKTGNCSRSG